MAYQPKIITGKVKGTGWPIDGHVLYLSSWDYDNHESWHLYGWDDADDEAVMLTMHQTETEADLSNETLEDFTKTWKAKQWEPQGSFTLPLDQVEVLEVKQEEQPDETREKLLAHGIDLSPRKKGEKGGILCLPLDKNLNGDVQAKHPDWQPVQCPKCGAKCWKPAEVEKLQKEDGVQLLCTKCALEAGLVQPYKQINRTDPRGNRAARRREARERRREHGKQR
jgi:hypothetical protein